MRRFGYTIVLLAMLHSVACMGERKELRNSRNEQDADAKRLLDEAEKEREAVKRSENNRPLAAPE